MEQPWYIKSAKAVLQKVGLYGLALRFYLYGKKMGPVYSPGNQWRRLKCLWQGKPLPPPELIFAVAGTRDAKWFLEGGLRGAESIHDLLARNNTPLDSLNHILDLGCGCGRVIRHLQPAADAELYGTDYNAKLIEWCKGNLKVGHFDVNDLTPPLSYSDGKFDFVYALSVFTHLPEHLQRSWMNELKRVIRPGGYLLITTHGNYYLDQLSPTEQARFQNGEMILRDAGAAGSNWCNVYHPEEYVRTKLAEGFEVVDFVPEGAKGNPRQDAVLLRRKSN
ncbi:MAG TPA: class I SAM-dependent methyltransferase [Pyrinomonadaceae bacterium]|jgi:SAM-dependent methyltransferase|nr:class I SAM-dependent methyltransferase [Pyrinomonadaceae bacterium]